MICLCKDVMEVSVGILAPLRGDVGLASRDTVLHSLLTSELPAMRTLVRLDEF